MKSALITSLCAEETEMINTDIFIKVLNSDPVEPLMWGKWRLECPAGMGGMSPELHGRGERQARSNVNFTHENTMSGRQRCNYWTFWLICAGAVVSAFDVVTLSSLDTVAVPRLSLSNEC